MPFVVTSEKRAQIPCDFGKGRFMLLLRLSPLTSLHFPTLTITNELSYTIVILIFYRSVYQIDPLAHYRREADRRILSLWMRQLSVFAWLIGPWWVQDSWWMSGIFLPVLMS
jgi:hypothetical protein